jgi:hypothetical protein
MAPLVVAAAALLAGCGASSQTTPTPTRTAAPPATIAVATAVASPSPFTAPTPPSTPSAQPTFVEPTTSASAAASQAAVTTPVPGSTLDPSMSDSGVVGRLIIPNDTRNDFTGTHDIYGLEADGSNCSFSLDGNEFTAVAWYDDAPDGMLHQMAVSVPADTAPANDGEQRAAISNGSVYADFATETGFGSAYSGAISKEDGSSSSIDIALNGGTMVFTFTGTTWDDIAFEGQMMCSGMAGGE